MKVKRMTLRDAIQFAASRVGDEALQQWEICEELGTKLSALSLRQLGIGSFAAVFGHRRGDWVIKVARDPAWADYADLSRETRNRHAPYIYYFKQLECRDGAVQIAVMERLTPVRCGWNAGSRWRPKHSPFRAMWRYIEDGERLAPNRRVPKSLCTWLRTIRSRLIDGGPQWGGDLHKGNFMWRREPSGRRTLVVVDPVFAP